MTDLEHAKLKTAEAPASSAQERLWVAERLDPGEATYNIPAAFRLSGRLNVSALRDAFKHIVRRHEILRTSYQESAGGELRQIILPAPPFDLDVLDLQNVPDAPRAEEVQSVIDQAIRCPFDLRGGPVFRTLLIQSAPDEHLLLIVLHHIASDAWSMSILFRELSAGYSAALQGAKPDLPALDIQYADYASWQKEQAAAGAWDDQLEFWTRTLSGPLPTLELPLAEPRPQRRTFRGSLESQPLVQSTQLQKLAREAKATPYIVLLAAFYTLLHRYTAAPEIIIGTPVAGRSHTEAEPLIGFFINTLALRQAVDPNTPFSEFLASVRQTVHAAFSNQDVPFDLVVQRVQPERSNRHSPLFHTMFSHEHAPDQELSLEGVRVEPMPVHTGTAKFDLTLMCIQRKDRIEANWEFNSALFDPDAIRQLHRHFTQLLASALDCPALPLSNLAMLAPDEERTLLCDWNNSSSEFPRERTVHCLFEDQARARPDAVALEYKEAALRYGELNRRTSLLAARLIGAGVQPGTFVGLCVERSFEMIAALLAILKVGAAYVPLDPEFPAERLEWMVDDAGITTLVTLEKHDRLFPRELRRIYANDAAVSESASPPAFPRVTADQPAYVNYTSGSTGRPKGVVVPHRAVVRLVKNTNFFDFSQDTAATHLAPLSFDASTLEIWGPLLNGGRVILFPPGPPALAEICDTVRRHRANLIWLTAGLFHLLVDEHPDKLASLPVLLTGGDVVSPQHAQRFLEAAPNSRLLNCYGPTENTTFTTFYPVRPDDDWQRGLPIGRPIANSQVYILDAQRHLLPPGVPGELFIGGDGLALGYHRSPELTSEKFVPHPFSTDPAARLYRTGDLCRFRRDGAIEFIGRLDQQVKIRGFRIEPAEVEAVLATHPSILQAAVVAWEITPGQKQLAGYCTSRSERPPSADELLNFLRERLPDFMVPSFLVLLDQMPLNPNGKIDRRALAPPQPAQPRHDPEPCLSDAERTVADLFASLLRLPHVSPGDNFFDRGGHSLLAIQAVSRLNKTFGIDLPLKSFFDTGTVRAVARAVSALTPTRHPISTAPANPEELLARLDQLSEDEIDALLKETHS